MRKIQTCVILFPAVICAFFALPVFAEGENLEGSFLEKARKVQAGENVERKTQVLPQPAEEKDTYSIKSSTLSLIRTGKEQPVAVYDETPCEEDNCEAPKTQPTAADTDKPNAASSVQKPQFKKETIPAAEPGRNVKWIDSSTRNFVIKVEPQTSGVMTPNLGMKFETVHQSLGKNIPWMMSGKAKVYVYQNRQSFLKNEPVASSWSGAFFSPSEDRIVMYDEPKNTSKMIEQFTHELTHLFVEEFFNPPSESYKLEPPIWLNEGLAVNMEDIASNTKGGVWASDLVVINILSDGEKKKLLSRIRSGQGLSAQEKRAAAANMVSAKTVAFTKFSDFIKNSSYDAAEQKGDVENWYFQAYAMVRFLFRTKNSAYPDKRMQFEQFTKLLKNFEDKKDANGNVVRDSSGRIVKKRISTEAALRKAYGFRDINDFENKFWKWLISMQTQERQKIKNMDKQNAF